MQSQLTSAAGGTGDFTVGEIVAGGTSNVTAEVKAWDSSNRQLQVFNRSGIFTIPETLQVRLQVHLGLLHHTIH